MDRAAAEQKTAELVAEYGSPDACPGVLLCDRHPGEAVAFTVVEPDLSYRDLTFAELGELSSRFAANLAALGVGPGDAVATLMGKSAELVVALLGIWRLGAVHVPLFTAFAPPAIEFRLARSGAKVVVADEDQRAKLDFGDGMPGEAPWRVISGGRQPGDLPLAEIQPAVTGPAAPLGLIFTSGTTGAPKGVPVPVRALAGISCYMEYGLDVQPEDVYWNAATHDQVIEAAVIGVPDELRGEVIEAFVVLREPSRGTEELAGELQQLVKDKFAAHAYPRRVHFVDALPKTPSGKVQRYLLRKQRS
jgi:acetyl-CoA synthetase